jgi:hypothetical protein
VKTSLLDLLYVIGQRQITITCESGWHYNRQMGMHDAHRFLENIFEELDAPGEWFHDRTTQTLYY